MFFLKRFQKNFFKKLSALSVMLALALTVAMPRVFTKFSFLHVYALEWVSCFFILLHIEFIFKQKHHKRTLSLLIPSFTFLVIGLIRFFIDLQTWSSDIPLIRGLQYALTFVYPAIWMLVGILFQDIYKKSVSLLFFAFLFIDSILHLSMSYQTLNNDQYINLNGKNLSLGPLIALLTVGAYFRFQTHIKKYFHYCLIALTFTPFWVLMQSEFNRTTLILMFFMYACAPLFFAKNNYKNVFKFYTTAFLIFALGASFSFLYRFKNDDSLSFKSKLIQTVQHGDDRTSFDGVSKEPELQFRSRINWWNDAIALWKSKPIFGVGFNTNVPMYIKPGLLNDGIFKGFEKELSTLENKPIAGPHNSYLSILARMGVLGFAAFIILFLQILWNLWFFISRYNSTTANLAIFKLLLFFIPVNGLVFALIGLGFESPYNCVLTWFSCGIIFAINRDMRIQKPST